jgi:hypothetical protein
VTSTLQLLYPERRHISTDKVLSWGFDAKVNAAVDDYVAQHGPFSDEPMNTDYERFVATITPPDLDEAIELLQDLGLATFATVLDEEAFRTEEYNEHEGWE